MASKERRKNMSIESGVYEKAENEWGWRVMHGGPVQKHDKNMPTSHHCLWKECFVRFFLCGRPYPK
jgi:hypothetical protein